MDCMSVKEARGGAESGWNEGRSSSRETMSTMSHCQLWPFHSNKNKLNALFSVLLYNKKWNTSFPFSSEQSSFNCFFKGEIL